jgi:hypothetical protein
VVYRFFSFVDTTKKTSKIDSFKYTNKLPAFEKDTFKLHANFRDPFLDRINKPVRVHHHTISLEKPKTKVETFSVLIPFPQITHLGIVNNASNNLKTHMISIDGVTHMITKIGKYGYVEVVDIQKDLIKIKFNGEVKTFHP